MGLAALSSVERPDRFQFNRFQIENAWIENLGAAVDRTPAGSDGSDEQILILMVEFGAHAQRLAPAAGRHRGDGDEGDSEDQDSQDDQQALHEEASSNPRVGPPPPHRVPDRARNAPCVARPTG